MSTRLCYLSNLGYACCYQSNEGGLYVDNAYQASIWSSQITGEVEWKEWFIVDGVQATCYIHSSRDKVTQNKYFYYHPQVGGGGIVRDPLVHKEVTFHCFAFELVPMIMS